MSASRGMAIATDMARRKRDAAAADLGRARAAELAAHNQFDQLRNYAGDTESRWTQQAQVRATPELMQHHYQFMARLHHAIGLQRDVLQQHARNVAARMAALRDCELRLSSLQMVLDRQKLAAQKAADRREQKQTDETAALQFRRSAAGLWEGAT